MKIGPELVSKIDELFSHGLTCGMGDPEPGKMCVEAAICYALGLPHSDKPNCVSPVIREMQIKLNDSPWSSNIARAKGMRNLAILQLGTNHNFDNQIFIQRLAMFCCTDFLPHFLSFQECDRFTSDLKEKLVNAKGLEDARNAARATYDNTCHAIVPYDYGIGYVVSFICSAVNDAVSENHSSCAYNAASAAYHASVVEITSDSDSKSESDHMILYFIKGVEKILIEMEVPGKEYLTTS